MASLGTIFAFIFAVSFMTFVTFFGRLPALRNTPIAGLYRLVWVHTPNVLLSLDQKATSGRLSSSLARFGHFLAHDRHPTVVIFFTCILIGAELLFVPTAWPQISLFTKLMASITIALPFIFLYLGCAADPGYITPDNIAKHLSLYTYDYALFHPGRFCRTCNLPKPPRSKHCSICKHCIARADHHCIFLNSCVGYGNHHWFLLLLLSTAWLTTYGAGLGFALLSADIRTRQPSWHLWPWHTSMSYTRWLSILSIGIHRQLGLGASSLLALLTSPLVWGFFMYSLYLVYSGTTTNETLKWAEWREDMQDGYAFGRSLSSDPHERNAQYEPAWTRWPAQPNRILVATSDGQPPRSDQHIPGEGGWERETGLGNVTNLYDLGFWNNLKDIFIQDYSFGSSKEEPPSERRYQRSSRNGSRYPP